MSKITDTMPTPDTGTQIFLHIPTQTTTTIDITQLVELCDKAWSMEEYYQKEYGLNDGDYKYWLGRWGAIHDALGILGYDWVSPKRRESNI